MNWLNSLVIAGAMICSTLTPLMASSQVYSAFREEVDPLLIWSKNNKHFTTLFYPHAKKSDRNFVFSPISLQLGMAMVAEVALNATQKEILRKTVLPKNPSIRHMGVERLLNQLNTGMAAGGEPVHLTLANGAWLSSDIHFPTYFETLLTQSYQATLNQADFRLFPEKTRQEINAWVEEKTLHQIQDLMPSGSIDSQTQLVLVNAVYMRAPWKKPFNPENTYEDLFYGIEKCLRPADYMHQRGLFGYLEDGKCLVVEIPFKQSASTDDALSLFAVLPNQDHSLEDIEKSLSTRRLNHWLTSTENKFLDLSLPKFQISSSMNAKEMFKELGMQRPFSPQNAEFDLNGGQNRVIITNIVHNAVLEVDEWGGTGSAGTGITIELTSCPETKEVKFNRPFLVFVADKTSGIVLFAGRVMQPKP